MLERGHEIGIRVTGSPVCGAGSGMAGQGRAGRDSG